MTIQSIQIEYDYTTADGSIASIHVVKEDGDTGMPIFIGSVIHTDPSGEQTRFPHVEWDASGHEWTESFPEYDLAAEIGKSVETRGDALGAFFPGERSNLPDSSLQQIAPISHGAEFFKYLRLLPGGWFITLTKSDESVHIRLPLHLFLKLYQEEER